MLRQYDPQRFTVRETPRGVQFVGTLPIGTVFRCGEKERSLIIDAWLPRCIGAGRKVNGRYEDTFSPRGGHLALCRDLSNGQRIILADHFIRFCVEND